jgi:hypothetical protein
MVKAVASNLSVRSGRVLTPARARDFILRVIHHGPISGEDALTSLTTQERESLLDLLETVEIRCYWTNVVLRFLSFSGYHQFTPDRIGLQSLSYYEPEQVTVAACLWAQR